MSAADPAFEWYDAWILCALLIAGHHESPVSLARLIAYADGINKAMVTRGELEVGIGRLVAADYVRVAPNGFEPTQKAMELEPLMVGDLMGKIGEAIGAGEWAPNLQFPSTSAEVYVTREAYQRAEKEYRRRDFWAKEEARRRS